MLHVHSSNRVEVLAEHLAELLRTPLADPFQEDVVLVHSQGLERWLSLQLAEALGVCAHVDFPFPVTFLTKVMVANTPSWDPERAALLEPETLVWALMEVLPMVAAQSGAEPLAAFLNPERTQSDVRLYQLSHRLAQLFDRYQIYRPQLLRRWQSGRVLEGERWQALVWQALIRRFGQGHRSALKDAFLQRLRNEGPQSTLTELPSRISLFGISSLAPFFVEILQALAPHTEVHFFFLNPCQEYWGDILSRKQRAKLSRRRGKTPDPWDQLELGLSAEPDFENELLAYFGKMGRDFFDLLVDLDHVEQHEDFRLPTGKSALAGVQHDILALQEGQGEWDHAEEAICPSIQVHSCHSAMREVEVLNDVLLDLFERHEGLTPRDVIVMAPRIEDYSSKIHAVFGRARSDERYLPYDIADRTPRLSHTLGSAFLRLLALPETRWEASEIFGILESVPVMRCFGITETGLDRLRHWVAASGARWAPDGDAKKAWDLPATHENTWAFGIERLLLGYAMPGREAQVFHGVLPYDHVEGGDVEILSAFLRFWDQLGEWRRLLANEHPAARWAALGRHLVREFFIDDPAYERELNFLYDLFDAFEEVTNQAGLQMPLTRAVFQAYVEQRLDESRSAGGFFTGGVTFCNLLPMRSIPFRVVVLLGMGARDFPRPEHQFTFDLMRETPMRGDRSRKHEDRYMFLEALLAARDHFIVLYTGQSMKDNSEMSPSVFVTQLRDYMERVFQWPEERYGRAHRLQPFSAAYFDPDSGFRTFAREYLDAPREMPLADPVSVDDVEMGREKKVVTVDDLRRFLQHPVAAFFQHQFGLRKPREALETLDVEPMGLNALEQWQLDQWILQLVEQGLSNATIGEVLRGSGRLPHGAHGESELAQLLARVTTFREHMNTFLGGPSEDPVPVDLEVGDWRVVGQLSGIYAGGLRRVRFGRVRPQDQYALWVDHLIAQSLSTIPNQPSALLGRGPKVVPLQEFATSHAALHELRRLVEWRARGLVRPLPLFPKASMTYAVEQRKRRRPYECRRKAEDVWKGRQQMDAEKDDYYHHLAFGQIERPLDREFEELSEKLVRPILDAQPRSAPV